MSEGVVDSARGMGGGPCSGSRADIMTVPHVGTVLLVDDDDRLRFVLLAHLRAAGFEAFEAVDGEQGVRLAREKSPDLIIMDVSMPNKDGLQATRELKEHADTAYDSGHHADGALAYGRPRGGVGGGSAGSIWRSHLI